MLMKILAIVVSCQPGSAGNGGRYRSACLSCRPGLRATWRHFCILCTTQTFFAYCVQHRPLPIVYFVCFILRSMVMKEWVGRGCRLWTFLIYVANQNIHLLHCCICIYYYHWLNTDSSLLERLGLGVWKITRRTTSLLCFVESLASFIPFALQSLFCMLFMLPM